MTPRVRRYLLAILAGLVIGFVVFVSTSRGLTTIRGGRLGGDLPAFYGAARVVWSAPHRLYEWEALRDAERDLFPGSDERAILFAYPPYVAALYLPLTVLPFKTAYVVYTLLMACCCAAAVALMCPFLPRVREEFLLWLVGTVTFYPLFRAVLGGQNTPISLLCAAGAANALARDRQLIAGIWIGAWLFKPQLALPAAAIVAIRMRRRSRFLAGICLVGAIYYAIGMAIGGAAWPVWWWREGARPFGPIERVINGVNAIALVELATAYHVAIVGWIAATAVGAYAVWIAWRRQPPPVALVAVAVAAAVLVAPHALYYDGGLSAIALLVAAARQPSTVPIVAAAWLLSWLQPLRAALPVPPMTIVTAASLWLAGRGRSAPALIADRNAAAGASAPP